MMSISESETKRLSEINKTERHGEEELKKRKKNKLYLHKEYEDFD
jgi:hypothetical protein